MLLILETNMATADTHDHDDHDDHGGAKGQDQGNGLPNPGELLRRIFGGRN